MPDSSKLLIDEPPLQVLPTLAKLLGIEQAIILQQVHYWVKGSSHEIGGYRWIYNRYKDWADQFPWLSERAIRHHVRLLEKAGLLITGDFNRDRRDHTKWYRIGFDALDELLTMPESGLTNPSGHATNIDSPVDESCHMQETNLAASVPETTPEITPKEEDGRPVEFIAYEQNIGMLTPVIADKILAAIKEYPELWIVKAIGIAAENNARSWRYVEVVLERWKAHGIDDSHSKDTRRSQDPDRYIKGKYGHMVSRGDRS